MGAAPAQPRASVAMVVYSDITFDSRVQREASTLAGAGYDVIVFCIAARPEGLAGIHPAVQIEIVPPDVGGVVPGSEGPYRRRSRSSRVRAIWDRLAWVASYGRTLRSWGKVVVARDRSFDIWHAHDFTGLVAIGGSMPRPARLVYDVHDLFLEAGVAVHLPRPARALLRRYEGRLIRRADLVIAANDGYGAIVQRRYGIPKPTAIHNCPPRWEPPDPPPDLIRKATAIPPSAPIVLYHGVLGANRGIEGLIDAIRQPGLEDAHVVLLGYGLERDGFIELAADPASGGRLHVLDPVAPSELLPWVASADLGAMVFPRATLNLYLTTPNKLFECIAAGVPTVISDFPGMRGIVMADPDRPLGAACDPASPADIARAIREVLASGRGAGSELRRRSADAARTQWNWEAEGGRLVAAYDGLAAAGPRVT